MYATLNTIPMSQQCSWRLCCLWVMWFLLCGSN